MRIAVRYILNSGWTNKHFFYLVLLFQKHKVEEEKEREKVAMMFLCKILRLNRLNENVQIFFVELKAWKVFKQHVVTFIFEHQN